MPDFHIAFKVLLHAINLRNGTDGFTFPPKEGVLRIFAPEKNPTVSSGFEPAAAELGYQRPARYITFNSQLNLMNVADFSFLLNLV
jgi:hypothetical protein